MSYKFPESAFVYQLNDAEMRHFSNLDITRFGATCGIYNTKKEDTLVVEKLKAYRAELEAKKVILTAPLDISEIEEKTAEYRVNLINEVEAAREAEVAKIDSDIACIDGLIERELKAAEVTPETTEVNEVTE